MTDNHGPRTAPTTDGLLALDLDQVNALSRGTLNERLGLVFLEATAERLVATMPVAGNVQPYGLLHGGASCVMVETLGSFGAALHAAPLGKIAVGIDLNATHHRAVSSGLVTGTATPLLRASSLATYAVTIEDDQGRLVCSARLTCLLRERPPQG